MHAEFVAEDSLMPYFSPLSHPWVAPTDGNWSRDAWDTPGQPPCGHCKGKNLMRGEEGKVRKRLAVGNAGMAGGRTQGNNKVKDSSRSRTSETPIPLIGLYTTRHNTASQGWPPQAYPLCGLLWQDVQIEGIQEAEVVVMGPFTQYIFKNQPSFQLSYLFCRISAFPSVVLLSFWLPAFPASLLSAFISTLHQIPLTPAFSCSYIIPVIKSHVFLSSIFLSTFPSDFVHRNLNNRRGWSSALPSEISQFPPNCNAISAVVIIGGLWRLPRHACPRARGLHSPGRLVRLRTLGAACYAYRFGQGPQEIVHWARQHAQIYSGA